MTTFSKENQLSFDELNSLILNKLSSNNFAEKTNSYTQILLQKGSAKIAQKVGEEAVEVVIASLIHDKEKSEKNRSELVGEVCDLLYHLNVLLASQQVQLSEIYQELHKRNQEKSAK